MAREPCYGASGRALVFSAVRREGSAGIVVVNSSRAKGEVFIQPQPVTSHLKESRQTDGATGAPAHHGRPKAHAGCRFPGTPLGCVVSVRHLIQAAGFKQIQYRPFGLAMSARAE